MIAEATRASADRAQGIVLSGHAGVGKTRVAREATASCGARSARRHWIIGTASARSVPLGAFADIASDFGPDPLRRVREMIDALIGDARPGEVVVGVDDAHLLDDLSAFTVHQLVIRRLATVILTIRSGMLPPDAITAIWKDHHLERLELQPLSLDETIGLVEQVLDGPVHSMCARRLWQYTQGNALYLRHLLDSEVGAGRIACPSGIWVWEGQPELSPTLAELVEARIARAPRPVRDVLDALAVTEPLDVDVLASVTDPDALADAESLGLISVDSGRRPALARLTHPLLGEVRRTGSLRLQRVRGRIVTELARKRSTDSRDLVRRAVLTLDSDLEPDTTFLVSAASAALNLCDLRLAEALAQQAVAAGGGLEAKLAQARAVTWQERGTEADAILAELAEEVAGPARAQVAILRAINFAACLGQAANAEGQLDEALRADDDVAQGVADALRSVIDLVRGHARAAVDRARSFISQSPADDVAHMLAVWAVVTGLGDLGCIDEIDAAAESGYRIGEQSADVSHLRLPLACLHAYGYRLAGALTQADAAIARIHGDTLDVAFEGSWHVSESWHAFLAALSGIGRGALVDTQRCCREALSYLGGGDSMLKGFARTWLATTAGMAGHATDARTEFSAIQWWDQDVDACEWDSEKDLAEAWVCAAEGAVSQAISITRSAADREASLGRPAWEVLLLQTATQFGDHTTAARLAELAVRVQGPRAPAAAAHASALAADDGDALCQASHRYEAFGDRIAAADAAAQAVIAYQGAGLRGAALCAAATVERLAAECQGAQTPALRAATRQQPFTARQREIISLAAQGLSNKEIADRLTVSVRSVEGHLFRASQRVAANSREQLISILHGP